MRTSLYGIINLNIKEDGLTMKSILIKTLIAIAGVLVLFFLFREANRSESVSSSADSEQALTQEGNSAFSFDPPELTYDGIGEIDLLSGVSLNGITGQPLRDLVFTKIQNGSHTSEKIIIYSADTESGKATARRTLKLINYHKPEITLPDELPEVTPDTAGSIISLLLDNGTLSVDDGFGNEAANKLSATCETDSKNSSILHYTFFFDSLFGDDIYRKVDTKMTESAVLIIRENEVTVPIDSDYNPFDNIISATDAEGADAKDDVVCAGRVNTAKPGVYTVTYTLNDVSLSALITVME